MSAGKLESALSATQDGAESALKVAATATRELRKAKTAAQGGQMRELRRALGVAESLIGEQVQDGGRRGLRPSVVIGLLAAAQQRPPRFRAEPFLESLAGGYELVVARAGSRPDAVARVTDIWSALTLLPGQGKDYTRPEFARDLYLLDQSGVQQTRSGRMLRWHASSGTRTAGMLTTVARTGQQQRYWGVSFSLPESR